MRMVTQRGGRLIATNVPLKFLSAVAFEMANPEAMIRVRILGGPDWIESGSGIDALAITAPRGFYWEGE